MEIGTAQLTFHLPHSTSLKAKRQVAHSIISRLRQRFNLSVAEVEGQDRWQILVVGMACVSNHHQHVNEMLDAAIAFVHGLHLDAELVEVERETV